jgi:hypothetical protein
MKVMSVATALLTILAAAGCATTKEPVVLTGEYLVERDGIWYEIDSEEPFTGMMAEYWPGGEKKVEVELVGGKVHGRLTDDHRAPLSLRRPDGEEPGNPLPAAFAGRKVVQQFRQEVRPSSSS